VLNINETVIQPISVLVIGADQRSERELREKLTEQPVNLTFVNSVYEAKQCILQDVSCLYNAYLFDNNEQYVENLALLKALKRNGQYAVVPVIFQADLEDPQTIQQSLQHGVYFYLLKPYTQELLLSVLKAAVIGFDHQQALSQNLMVVEGQAERLESRLQTADFQIKTIEDARSLACALAFIAPNPQEAVVGLFELMTNAIEHGNLNITYEEKTTLILTNQLHSEIERRQKLPENCDKFVSISFERNSNELQFIIRDMGQGFNYASYLDFSVERAMDSHGRGVMIANKLSFDSLHYEDNGRTAIGRIFN
jgi:CheY-like chemotaxis protein